MATRIAYRRTRERLGCTVLHMLRQAEALGYLDARRAFYQLKANVVSEDLYEFCIDVMAGIITPKAKKRGYTNEDGN